MNNERKNLLEQIKNINVRIEQLHDNRNMIEDYPEQLRIANEELSKLQLELEASPTIDEFNVQEQIAENIKQLEKNKNRIKYLKRKSKEASDEERAEYAEEIEQLKKENTQLRKNSKYTPRPSRKHFNKVGRGWVIIVYPESAPADWIDQLEATGLRISISPLHDSDINDDGETLKKAHHHVLIVFENSMSYSNVDRLAFTLNAPTPQKIESIKGTYAYHTHAHNPEKFQYDEEDIRNLNGFVITQFRELTAFEKNEIKMEIFNLIANDTSIVSYTGLLQFLQQHKRKDDYVPVATNSTAFFREIVKDNYFALQREKENKYKKSIDIAKGNEKREPQKR